jgi:hypothetical protein
VQSDFRAAEVGSFEAGVRGFVCARSGNRGAALLQIRTLDARPYRARSMTFVLLAVEPMFDSLHGDPGYQQIVAQIRPN